jgi:peptidoglycan/LPS O-acetylase OafA/YrhL
MQAATTYHLSSQLPSVQVLIPQLLLIGDFFQTPYTLQGVEWTLRVEIMFYIFMGCLRYLQMLHKHKRALPFVLIGTTILLAFSPPFPATKSGQKATSHYMDHSFS